MRKPRKTNILHRHLLARGFRLDGRDEPQKEGDPRLGPTVVWDMRRSPARIVPDSEHLVVKYQRDRRRMTVAEFYRFLVFGY